MKNLLIIAILFCTLLSCKKETVQSFEKGKPVKAYKPVVTIISPVNGATVTGIVPVVVNVTGAIGLTRVDFIANFYLAMQATTYTFPYTLQWNTSQPQFAGYSNNISVNVTDANGMIGVSSIITVHN